jgi:vitamin B12 transporter
MQKLLNLLIIFFLFSSFSFADEAPIFRGEEIVVTAARYPQFVSESPWNTTVLKYEDLEATGARNLGDALRSVLGMDIKSNGYQGAITSFKLRGVAAEEVLILIDGMRVASPLLGVADAADILVSNVERVEVVRGASSSLYGSDAIGGVINVITRKPSKNFGLSGNILYGTFNTGNVAFSVQGKSGVGYEFSASLDKTDGFRENSAAEQQNYSGKLMFDLGGDELALGLNY